MSAASQARWASTAGSAAGSWRVLTNAIVERSTREVQQVARVLQARAHERDRRAQHRRLFAAVPGLRPRAEQGCAQYPITINPASATFSISLRVFMISPLKIS